MVHCTVINGSVTTDGHNHQILLRLPWNVESHKHMSLRMDFSLGVDYYNCSASRFPLIVLPRRRNIGISNGLLNGQKYRQLVTTRQWRTAGY